MNAAVEHLIDDYAAGRLTRRQFATHVTTLVASAALVSPATAQEASPSTFRAIDVNHVALSVSDVARSRDFYVEHLGLRVAAQSSRNCFLACETSDNFLALFQSANVGLSHYCFAVEGYSVNVAAERLRARGFEPRVTGNRIYFPDPDGLTVQLAEKGHGP